jgi:hypothetical protein
MTEEIQRPGFLIMAMPAPPCPSSSAASKLYHYAVRATPNLVSAGGLGSRRRQDPIRSLEPGDGSSLSVRRFFYFRSFFIKVQK